MKTLNTLIVALVIVMLSITSCSQDETGPSQENLSLIHI